MATLYDFLNSFFQNSWSQRFAKVRLTGRCNYKHLHHTHISGDNKLKYPEFVKRNRDTIQALFHPCIVQTSTKNSKPDSLLYTVHIGTFVVNKPFSLHFGIWTLIYLKFFLKRVEPLLFSPIQKTIEKCLPEILYSVSSLVFPKKNL